MPKRIEITLKPELFDAEGAGIQKKARDYFNIELSSVRTIHIVTIDSKLSLDQIECVQKDILTNPVTQFSSLGPLSTPFDWTIWVGFRPGVRDNPASTAKEAIEDLLRLTLGPEDAIYTSKRYCFEGRNLTQEMMDTIARELLANDIIQQWKIFEKGQWNEDEGIGYILPKVRLNHTPTVSEIPIDSDETLRSLSKERNLALNDNDIPVIRSYFLNDGVKAQRAAVGLEQPTDVELEYISQGRSDHCNHNTFTGLFHYKDMIGDTSQTIDNLFDTCIKTPTLKLQSEKSWVKSVLWDNAGVARFDDDHHYVITGETHNSPSNMEAYGGAITGIVGIYRDPMGTGKGAKLVMGSYGYCVGPRDYDGPLVPRLHPRRLLDGIVEGVRDGGNKSGIPTPFGQLLFHPGYLGKCLVFVTAIGIMPSVVDGAPSEEKTILPGDLCIMSGGRVGKDGIHGVTASSESFSENTPAGHVQIGDPYTQKKMHDFLLEARDEGLIRFITDNGGGGLSSSVGETARFSGGCHIDLDKVPLKYEGLDQWEIWVSESQERMTIAIDPLSLNRFMALSEKHAVESTVIGTYTDSGVLHIEYNGNVCAHIDIDFLTSAFPQWEFDAEWISPEQRGLVEPVLGEPTDMAGLIKDLLSRPNICSKEWIARQYDHEVQGSSVIKPLVGKERDIPSDAAVLQPILHSEKGLAFAQALIPMYSAIDAYHMTTATIDEATRRVIAVGGNPDEIGGVDNFCWPNIQYDEKNNPDGRFKAAQLVRSCKALKDMCLDYGIPLLSGKDSMYVDGHLSGPYGQSHKVSALETLQFSVTTTLPHLTQTATLTPKVSDDLVYIIGETKNELGGSEYYEHLGYIGLNVPQVSAKALFPMYRTLHIAIQNNWIASAHGVYRGGLGIHLPMVAMAGVCGLEIDLSKVPTDGSYSNSTILFSESAGRFIVTVNPTYQEEFENLFADFPVSCVGKVLSSKVLIIKGMNNEPLTTLPIDELKTAWKKPFKDTI